MLNWLRRIFCRHSWQICRKVSGGFAIISGEQLYKRCSKCGKVKKWIYVEYEGDGFR